MEYANLTALLRSCYGVKPMGDLGGDTPSDPLNLFGLLGFSGSWILQALGFFRLLDSSGLMKGRGRGDEFALLDGNGDLNPRAFGFWVVLGADFAGVGFDNLLHNG